MKECKDCKQSKKESEFYARESSKDGLMTECRKCHYQKMKKYYATEEGRNKLRAGQRKYAKKLKALGVSSLKEAKEKYGHIPTQDEIDDAFVSSWILGNKD